MTRLCKRIGIRLPASLRTQQTKRYALLLRDKADKAVVVGTGHHHVDVVIPRDEPLVTHRTDQGAARQAVVDAVRLAHVADRTQHLQTIGFDLVDLQSFFIHHSSFSPLVLANLRNTQPRTALGIITCKRKRFVTLTT